MSSNYKEFTFTIANNSDTSDVTTVTEPDYIRGQMSLCRVMCPATLTTVVANIQVSEDNVRFDDLYDETGTKITFSAVQATSVALTPSKFAITAPYVRLKLASAQATGGAVVFKAYARAV